MAVMIAGIPVARTPSDILEVKFFVGSCRQQATFRVGHSSVKIASVNRRLWNRGCLHRIAKGIRLQIQGSTQCCDQPGAKSITVLSRPRDSCAVVDIKMSANFLELLPVADVHHRLSQTFCVSRFPIGSMIVVSEVRDNELRVSDLYAHDVVDNSCLLHIAQVYKINSQLLSNSWFHHIANEYIKLLIAEFHGDKPVVAIECTELFPIVLLPAVQA